MLMVVSMIIQRGMKMISVETFMYIMIGLYIISGLSNIHSGVQKSAKEQYYGSANIIGGLIALICSIIALMW